MLCGDTNKIMRKKFRKRTQIPSAGQKQGGGRDPAHPLQGCRRALHRVFKGGDRSGDCHKTYALLCAILPSLPPTSTGGSTPFSPQTSREAAPTGTCTRATRSTPSASSTATDPADCKKRPFWGADFRVTRGWLQARFSLPRRACSRRGAVLRALAPTCGNTPRRAAAP